MRRPGLALKMAFLQGSASRRKDLQHPAMVQGHGSPADMQDLGDHARHASRRSGHLTSPQQDDFHRRHRPSILQGADRFETSSTRLARPRRSPSRNSFACRRGGRDDALSMARCRRSTVTICERSRLSLQHSLHLRRPGSHGAWISYRSDDSSRSESALEHFHAKWPPLRVTKMRQNKKL